MYVLHSCAATVLMVSSDFRVDVRAVHSPLFGVLRGLNDVVLPQ